MRALLADLIEPLSLLFYGTVVAILTVGSVSAELLGFADLLAGGGLEMTALWYVYLGGVGLAAAVAIARRRLFPRLSDPFDSDFDEDI